MASSHTTRPASGVSRSGPREIDRRVPECDLARAALARGITGSVTLLDGRKPRIVIDIEKAAKLTVEENRRNGPRFVEWRPYRGRRAAHA